MQRYALEGTLTQAGQYCGGAAISDEEMMRYTQPTPYGTMLYIRKGKQNKESVPIYDSTRTDGSGHFKFMVPPGEYVIILPSQRKKKIIRTYLKMANKDLKVDSVCLSKWWSAGLFQVKVEDRDVGQLDYCFHDRCFVPVPVPCFSYTGPYPP